jgi:hypothetical protein
MSPQPCRTDTWVTGASASSGIASATAYRTRLTIWEEDVRRGSAKVPSKHVAHCGLALSSSAGHLGKGTARQPSTRAIVCSPSACRVGRVEAVRRLEPARWVSSRKAEVLRCGTALQLTELIPVAG